MSVETSTKNLRATEGIRVCVVWRLPGRKAKSLAALFIHGRVQSSVDEAFAAKNCVILVRIWRRETVSPTRKSAEFGVAMACCKVRHGRCASAE
jgi:hypothetical protein